MEGTGLFVVAAVGRNSYYGKLQEKLLITDNDTTPLQEKLTELAYQIGTFVIYVTFVTFVAMLAHKIYDCTNEESFFTALLSVKTLLKIIDCFIIAVSLIFVAVPEGLPLVVTTVLAYSINKMKDENNFVRDFQACEKMGAANNICSDKTGTLTKNLMTVTRIFIEEDVHKNMESNIARENSIRLLCLSVCNNINASPTLTVKGNNVINKQIGNKTDCGLLEMAFRMGYDYKQFRNRDQQLKVFPFSSSKKKMATVYQDDKGVIYVFVKGAPDFLLPYCTKYVDKNG